MVFIHGIFLRLRMSTWPQLLASSFQFSSSKHGRTKQAQSETRCLIGTHFYHYLAKSLGWRDKEAEDLEDFVQVTFKIQFLLTLLHYKWTPLLWVVSIFMTFVVIAWSLICMLPSGSVVFTQVWFLLLHPSIPRTFGYVWRHFRLPQLVVEGFAMNS